MTDSCSKSLSFTIMVVKTPKDMMVAKTPKVVKTPKISKLGFINFSCLRDHGRENP